MRFFSRQKDPAPLPAEEIAAQKAETTSPQPDGIERIKLRFSRRLKRITEIGLLQLDAHQVFPPRELMGISSLLPQNIPLISKQTPVGSMGSCFAREIRDYLIAEDYNYVQHGEGRDAEHGSARWNRVYNTGCILQEFKRAFGEFDADLLVDETGKTYDPHRKQAVYDTLEEAQAEITTYKAEARAALLESKVFVITLGLSEVWYNKNTGSIYAEAPPKQIYDSARDSFKILSPEDNSANLRAAVTFIKEQNPDIDIIVTVSPVPLRATFVPRSALVSNTVSKAALVWAAHEISNEFDFVHYFPSYEIVQYMIENPFEWDFRHVKRSTVSQIMSVFRKGFVQD